MNISGVLFSYELWNKWLQWIATSIFKLIFFYRFLHGIVLKKSICKTTHEFVRMKLIEIWENDHTFRLFKVLLSEYVIHFSIKYRCCYSKWQNDCKEQNNWTKWNFERGFKNRILIIKYWMKLFCPRKYISHVMKIAIYYGDNCEIYRDKIIQTGDFCNKIAIGPRLSLNQYIKLYLLFLSMLRQI
jgi:hypothetical protein